MIIDSDRRQLKITLSATEICDYFGSFEDIRYDNAKARLALGNILRRAMEDTDFKLCSERLSIKVFPTQSGGCNIYFILGGGRRLMRVDRLYIYDFADCEDMLRACEQIKRISADILLSIYTKDARYRVIIEELKMNRRLLKIGSEFAEHILSGRQSISKTKEHWHKICDNTPVGKIIV